MVFNLTTRQQFHVKDHSLAIICRANWGPCFGNGELATREPFNGNNNCWSYINQKYYGIPESNGMNQLTNTEVDERLVFSDFTISEIEVWEVKFIE